MPASKYISGKAGGKELFMRKKKHYESQEIKLIYCVSLLDTERLQVFLNTFYDIFSRYQIFMACGVDNKERESHERQIDRYVSVLASLLDGDTFLKNSSNAWDKWNKLCSLAGEISYISRLRLAA